MRSRTVRLYGRTLNTWSYIDDDGRERITQWEIAYREYDAATGEIVATGSEDFSPERLPQIKAARVWTWDGERRNRGGHRWFDEVAFLRYRASDRAALREYLRVKHPDSAAVDIRVIF